jgi:hypothetical protein
MILLDFLLYQIYKSISSMRDLIKNILSVPLHFSQAEIYSIYSIIIYFYKSNCLFKL